MPDAGEASLRGHLVGPALHRLALNLNTASAVAARQVMVVGVSAAAPVEGLAARVPDRVDPPVGAEHLEVPVHGGQSDVLALAAQFRVDLLRAAEPGQLIQRGGQRFSLPGAADPGAAGRGGRRITIR